MSLRQCLRRAKVKILLRYGTFNLSPWYKPAISADVTIANIEIYQIETYQNKRYCQCYIFRHYCIYKIKSRSRKWQQRVKLQTGYDHANNKWLEPGNYTRSRFLPRKETCWAPLWIDATVTSAILHMYIYVLKMLTLDVTVNLKPVLCTGRYLVGYKQLDIAHQQTVAMEKITNEE